MDDLDLLLAAKIKRLESHWRRDCDGNERHVHELLSLLHEKIAKKMKRGKYQLKYVNSYAKDVWRDYWGSNQSGVIYAPKGITRHEWDSQPGQRFRGTSDAIRRFDANEAREAAASPEWAHFIEWVGQDRTYPAFLDRYGYTDTRKGREAFKSTQHAYNVRFRYGVACKIFYVGVMMAPQGYVPYIRDVDRVPFDHVFPTQLECAEWIEGGREECGLPPLNDLPPFDFSWANEPLVFLRVA